MWIRPCANQVHNTNTKNALGRHTGSVWKAVRTVSSQYSIISIQNWTENSRKLAGQKLYPKQRNVSRHLWSMAKYAGPVISFKPSTEAKERWPDITLLIKKIMNAALRQIFKFLSLSALLLGREALLPKISAKGVEWWICSNQIQVFITHR